MKSVRIGVVGLGSFGVLHCQVLNQLPDVEIGGLVSRSEERLREVGDRFKVEALYTDFDSMLAQANIDAVYVTSASEQHFVHCRAALAGGKHVFVEKPLALTSADGEAIEDLATATDRFVQVGFVSRFDLRMRRLKELITSGSLGKIAHLRFSRACSRDVASGGQYADPVNETMAHDVDLALWLTDANVARLAAHKFDALGMGRPDGCTALLVLDSGTGVSLHTDWLIPTGAPRNLRAGSRSLAASCEAVGSAGRVSARLMSNELTWWQDQGVIYPITGLWDEVDGYMEGALVKQSEAFVRAVRASAGAASNSGLRHALHGLKVCEAIRQAATELRQVEVT